jgi:F-type H+-transporting ATPase subunit a
MASFAPEVIFYIGNFPVTNTVINTILVDGILLTLAFTVRNKVALIPGKFMHLIELFIGGINGFVEGIAENKTKVVFPVFMTFFLFISVANLSGLIPGIGAFGKVEYIVEKGKIVKEIIPFNRPTTSDFNTTFALAIISLCITNGYAIHKLGFVGYASKFLAFIPFVISVFKGKPKKPNVNFKQPIEVFIAIITPIVLIFVGLLELISEIVRAVSLSFRLFGNIYAGEVVLETVNGIFAFIFPIPFFLLETIAGVIQALVFSMLTMVFMIILSTPHHEEKNAESPDGHTARGEVSH